MNCKPGDMAIIVRATGTGLIGEVARRAVGSIVRVVRLGPPRGKFCTDEMVWEFEKPLFVHLPGRGVAEVGGAGDELLQPIRGSEGEDEILRIAGKPQSKPIHSDADRSVGEGYEVLTVSR